MVPDTLSVVTGPAVHPAAMSDGTCRLTTAAPPKDPVAVGPSTVVDAIPPLGQAVAPFQLITAERTAPVGDDEEQAKGLEAKVPCNWGEPKPRTIEESVVQPDKLATMDVDAPPPDPESGGLKVTVPENEHVAALLVMVWVVADAIVAEETSAPVATMDPTRQRATNLRTRRHTLDRSCSITLTPAG
jgi:hypothetical protein